MREGEELVEAPFQRLIEADQLLAFKHEGFWRPMDTLKDKQILEDLVEHGTMPWFGGREIAAAHECPEHGWMRQLGIARPGERLSVLCLGAHSDDIEIGAGATIRGWIESGVRLDVHWVVLSAAGERGDEARASADAISRRGRAARTIELGEFRDGFFPYQGAEIKMWFEALRNESASRTSSSATGTAMRTRITGRCRKLTWNTFRNHLILEYEIPKWDGDLGRPNVYVPATRSVMDRKVELLLESLRHAAVEGLVRLRGVHRSRALARQRVPGAGWSRRGLPCAQARSAVKPRACRD